MRVTVLLGGWSAEREVSLVSGAGILAAARALGHEAVALDMGQTPAEGASLADRLLESRPDVVFNALHGTPGEDGTVQGLMDLVGLRYTHSGVAASAIAIDKQLTKRLLVPAGIRMPAGRLVQRDELYAADPLPRPYVLKPVNEGSSVGVAIIRADSNCGTPVRADAAGPWQQFPQLLAEPFIPGLELTVSVLEDPQTGRAEALAVTELRPHSGFYDYEAKYTDGRTTHICPAGIDRAIEARARAEAVAAHHALGCRGVSRADFRWTANEGADGLYLLEVNTQPGMTPLSLVPEQARYAGLSYEALVGRILESACR